MNIILYDEKNNFLKFYLTSFKNIIFKLELCYFLGINKIIFYKMYLRDDFIISLKQKSETSYSSLNWFFKMII